MFTKTETAKRLRVIAAEGKRLNNLPSNSKAEVGLRVLPQHADNAAEALAKRYVEGDDLADFRDLDGAEESLRTPGAVVHVYLFTRGVPGDDWDLESVVVGWLGTPGQEPVLLDTDGRACYQADEEPTEAEWEAMKAHAAQADVTPASYEERASWAPGEAVTNDEEAAAAYDAQWYNDDDLARCVACGERIDYCQGHGELGDRWGFAVLEAHDAGDHSTCHPAGCEHAGEGLETLNGASDKPASASAYPKPYRHPMVGSVLQNGALVLAVREEADEDGRAQGYLLALTHQDTPTFAEYVTWAYVIDERGDVTVSGHYFNKNLPEALANLESRFGAHTTGVTPLAVAREMDRLDRVFRILKESGADAGQKIAYDNALEEVAFTRSKLLS